jgi:hypothetical protein
VRLLRPEVANAFAERFRVRPAHISGVLAFFDEIYREVLDRFGGKPIDNRSTIYNGFGDDALVNTHVVRYAPDLEAQHYLASFYTPSGAITDPVLTVHTTYDPIVSPDWVARYDDVLALAERFDLFVGWFVPADGHCSISFDIVGQAFDNLRPWAATGERPDRVTNQ